MSPTVFFITVISVNFTDQQKLIENISFYPISKLVDKLRVKKTRSEELMVMIDGG